MRLSAIAFGVAATGVAPALALPLRVLYISSNVEASPVGSTPSTIRFGHPIPTHPDIAMYKPPTGEVHHVGMKVPCAGRMGRFRNKAIELSNAFRQALGLPLIEDGSHASDSRVISVSPFIGAAPTFIEVNNGQWGRTKGGEKVQIMANNAPPAHYHHGPHHHVHGQMRHNKPFLTRLNESLLNLGPGEGSAVAFVLGCGIGVLLRMFWVLTVVLFRSVNGKREDEYEYTSVAIIEEVENMPSSPPSYTYPVDEKAVLEAATKGSVAPPPPSTEAHEAA